MKIKEMLHDHILERLYNMRIRGSEQHKTVMAYDQDIKQDAPTSCQRLKTVVEKFLGSKTTKSKF